MTLGETLHAVIADNLSSYSPTGAGAHLVGNHAGGGGAGCGSMPPPCSLRRKEPSISGSLAPSATPNNNNNNSGIQLQGSLSYSTHTLVDYLYFVITVFARALSYSYCWFIVSSHFATLTYSYIHDFITLSILH